MKVNIYSLALVFSTFLCFNSCSDDKENPTPNEAINNTEGSNNDDNYSGQQSPEIVVTVDADGKADGGHRFTKIDEKNYLIDDIKYTYKFDKYSGNNGELEVTGYDPVFLSGDAIIISKLIYNGQTLNVTGIWSEVLKNCKGITTLTIGNGPTSIGQYAFSGCSGLTSVNIPNSITSIYKSAFSGCYSLKAVHINDLAAWCKIYFEQTENYSFNSYSYYFYSNPLSQAHHLYLNGKEIKDELIIPNGVEYISSGVFCGSNGLTSVTIPSSVRSISSRAFYGCKLTSVKINSDATVSYNNTKLKDIFGEEVKTFIVGDSVKSIGPDAFLDYSSLTSVKIGNSVTSIGYRAFERCIGLTSIAIPASVTSIGSVAFNGCIYEA